MNNTRLQKGFTLVEIMIVVVIIALLATLAIPALSKARTKAQGSAANSNLQQLGNAAQQYFNENPGITSAAYTDLVGSTTDKQIHSITTQAGEDYSDVTITNTQTQISVTSATLGTITYNM